MIKVHPDAGGPHYTILTDVKDAKEKNTTAERISKVFIGMLRMYGLIAGSRQHTGVSCWPGGGGGEGARKGKGIQRQSYSFRTCGEKWRWATTAATPYLWLTVPAATFCKLHP